MNTADHDWKRRQMLRSMAFVAGYAMTGPPVSAKQTGNKSGKVELDGIGVYYEVHGAALSGDTIPIVLLHGGALTIELAFSPELVARFGQRRPVILIEQQGHGHTADRPAKPMTIDQMVADTAGVLSHLGVWRADLFGHSLGGIIATGLAIRHPNLVRSVTALGAPFQLDGFIPELARIQRDPTLNPSPELIPLLPTEADIHAWREGFKRVAPDPSGFDSILERLNAMLGAWPGWTEAELRAIDAQMLIALGDHDYVRIDHAAGVSHIIPKARLAVLPGTTHLGVVKRDAWLQPMMESLAEPVV
jgi:pimeloyl-ACP methyl ester carboxylesterase